MPSIPYLADKLLGVQEQLHDNNLCILDFGTGHFGQTRWAPYLPDDIFGVQDDHNLYILDLGMEHFGKTR